MIPSLEQENCHKRRRGCLSYLLGVKKAVSVNLKPRPNDRNMPTYRNIVGRKVLCEFGHRVAMCCDMLSVVGSSLKMHWSNLSQQHPTRRKMS